MLQNSVNIYHNGRQFDFLFEEVSKKSLYIKEMFDLENQKCYSQRMLARMEESDVSRSLLHNIQIEIPSHFESIMKPKILAIMFLQHIWAVKKLFKMSYFIIQKDALKFLLSSVQGITQ